MEIDKKNKIIVAIDTTSVHFRRDEFYALLTWIFNSPSYNDFMDEFINVNVSDPNVPACKLIVT